MAYNPEIHHRRSVRLKGYDYSAVGAYFVTICVYGRECLFGKIVGGEMRLNQYGEIIRSVWEESPGHFPSIDTDTYVIMPNHFHGIIVVGDNVGAGFPRPILETRNQPRCVEAERGGENQIPGGEKGGETPPLRKPTIGQVVGYFKYQSSKQVNMLRDNSGVPLWQRNYYERIIRSDAELNAARKYILENPLKWDQDKENPVNARNP